MAAFTSPDWALGNLDISYNAEELVTLGMADKRSAGSPSIITMSEGCKVETAREGLRQALGFSMVKKANRG